MAKVLLVKAGSNSVSTTEYEPIHGGGTFFSTSTESQVQRVIRTTGTFSDAIQSPYIGYAKEQAISDSVPILDNWSRQVSGSYTSAAGWLADTVHPNAVGYSDMADGVAQFISGIVGVGSSSKLNLSTNGSFVCNGATTVTVSDISVSTTDVIIPSLNTVGGTVGSIPSVKTITSGTGFTVACTALDTSTYNYAVIRSAP